MSFNIKNSLVMDVAQFHIMLAFIKPGHLIERQLCIQRVIHHTSTLLKHKTVNSQKQL